MSDNYHRLQGGGTDEQPHTHQLQAYPAAPLFKRKYLGITYWEYTLFFGTIVLISVLNLIFREYLYGITIDIILKIQTEGRNPIPYFFFDTVKESGSSIIVYGTLILIYVYASRGLAIHYTLIISAMMFFLCFLKMIVRYPRPYQLHPDIMPTSCSGQFGDPSATSIRVSTIVMSLFLDFFYSKRHRISNATYYTSCVVTNVIIVGTMCSRVYLAAHSINQVIYGGVVGLSIAIFMHFSVKPRLYKHLVNLSSQSYDSTNYLLYVCNATTVFSISILIPIVTYYILIGYTEIPQLYYDNLIRKCPPNTIEKVFHERAFPYIGKTALSYFAYLGVLTQHRFFQSRAVNHTDVWKGLIRLMLSLVVAFAFIWQLELVTWNDGIYLLLFNKTVIPCGGCAFILCAFGDIIFEKMGLMNMSYSHKLSIYVHHRKLRESQEDKLMQKNYYKQLDA